jgi:hypothetical protein
MATMTNNKGSHGLGGGGYVAKSNVKKAKTQTKANTTTPTWVARDLAEQRFIGLVSLGMLLWMLYEFYVAFGVTGNNESIFWLIRLLGSVFALGLLAILTMTIRRARITLIFIAFTVEIIYLLEHIFTVSPSISSDSGITLLIGSIFAYILCAVVAIIISPTRFINGIVKSHYEG